jgi:predicted membrane channel-forming protein YqfA (hemolysin III family)
MGSLFYFFKPSGAKQVMGVLRSSFLYALLAFSMIPVFLVPSQNILAILFCAVVVAIAGAAAVIEILFWKKSIFVSALSSFAVICVGLLWFNGHAAELPTASPLLLMAAGFMNILWACFHAVEKARPTTGVFGFREISNIASLASSTLFFFAWIGVVAGA